MNRVTRVLIWVGIGLATAVVVVTASIWLSQRPRTYKTSSTQRRSVTLSDGSKVDLNAGSAISVWINPNQRHIQMYRGEAYFEVKHQVGRPFLVETECGTVWVRGTKFNVRADRRAAWEVTVMEGSVSAVASSFNIADMPMNLQAGDQLHYHEGTKAKVNHVGDTAAAGAVAWRIVTGMTTRKE